MLFCPSIHNQMRSGSAHPQETLTLVLGLFCDGSETLALVLGLFCDGSDSVRSGLVPIPWCRRLTGSSTEANTGWVIRCSLFNFQAFSFCLPCKKEMVLHHLLDTSPTTKTSKSQSEAVYREGHSTIHVMEAQQFHPLLREIHNENQSVYVAMRKPGFSDQPKREALMKDIEWIRQRITSLEDNNRSLEENVRTLQEENSTLKERVQAM